MSSLIKISGGGGASISSNTIENRSSTLSAYSLSTSAQTVVGAINEISPKATGVGKIDPNSNGNGEIFNNYNLTPNLIQNSASGNYSHAEGYGTTASGEYSHAEGEQTAAIGETSHAEGCKAVASGPRSHAEGFRTTASGEYSHAEGFYTSASSVSSHAEGFRTTASGSNSHAEGRLTKAIGNNSHAEGDYTIALGSASHAEGYWTSASNTYEHAEGRYNISNSGSTDELKTRHSVGIGTKSKDRKNAHEIMANGDHYIYGLGGYDGTNATADTSQTLQKLIISLIGISVDYNQPTNSYTGSDSTTIYKVFDLSALNYIPKSNIILLNGTQELKYQYSYGETTNGTMQFNDSNSISYDLINVLSPLITNIFGIEHLDILHGRLNSETDNKYYLIIQE